MVELLSCSNLIRSSLANTLYTRYFSKGGILIMMNMRNLTTMQTYLLPLMPLWWRLSVTTERPVAKDTKEMVTP